MGRIFVLVLPAGEIEWVVYGDPLQSEVDDMVKEAMAQYPGSLIIVALESRSIMA